MSAGPGAAPTPARPPAHRLLEALALGAVGGAVFYYFRLPLAWMMGAMVFTTVASMSGRPLFVPQRLRSVMITVLGVLLGSTFTPEIVEQAPRWWLTLLAMAGYLVLLTGLLYLWFHRVMGYDPVTAYFSATPGGLNEMTIVGGAMGGDDRLIALTHAARVLLTVMVIPIWFRFSEGLSAVAAPGPSLVDTPGIELVTLLACAVIGVWVGQGLRLPAPRLVGPMLVSAVVHATGLSASAPPFEAVAVAQVVVGSSVGARFAGVPLRRVLRALAGSLGATVAMLLATLGVAAALAPVTDIGRGPIVLAFAPGGLAEMSLVALALGIETAFVASHHVVRIALIIIAAPLVFRAVGGGRLPPAQGPPTEGR